MPNFEITASVTRPSFKTFGETWSVKLRREHSMKMFESKVLRKMSEPKW